MPEKLEIIVECYTHYSDKEFAKYSPWVTINYGAKEFVTSSGHGENCAFTSNHFELGEANDDQSLTVKLWTVANDVTT